MADDLPKVILVIVVTIDRAPINIERSRITILILVL